MNDERIWSLAKEQQAWVSSVRRALHRVPEPGFREEKTKKLICEKLNEIGVAPVCERGWITAVVDSGEDGGRGESLSSTAAESLQRAVRNYLKKGNGDMAQALVEKYAQLMTPAQRRRFDALLSGGGQ